MSFYDGYIFFACLIPILIIAVIIGVLEKPLRFYSLFASLLFIFLVFGKEPIQLIYLLAFYLLELGIVKGYLFLRTKYGRKEKTYYFLVFLAILPLILCKISPFLSINIFGFLGISYLTFRAVQMVIEIYDGVITEVPIVEFTGFLLFFPSLSSGPIDRSRRFHEDWLTTYNRKDYLNLVGDGLFKICLGLVYKIVLAALFYKAMSHLEDGTTIPWLIGYAYTYGFYLFFDFAGYSLMAIGTAYILGVKTPDNFNKPFISIDIKDFWNRWHITLSHWFRDFIFSRFIIKCVKKKWFNSRLQRASAGFIVNMFIMGAWHGLDFSYLLYGLYHGVLLALTEIYQKKSKFYKKNKDKKIYKIVSWFITLQLVMFGFLIFSGRFLAVLK
ncbi:MAG: D-alanyl-lipoteichoic acid biosynthesis protein DltB [Clostridiales bacterium]